MKHKHAEIIKAWADGAAIECLSEGTWVGCEYPKWYHDVEYRVKPTEPEVKNFSVKAVLSLSAGPLFYPVPDSEANIRLAFKGTELVGVFKVGL